MEKNSRLANRVRTVRCLPKSQVNIFIIFWCIFFGFISKLSYANNPADEDFSSTDSLGVIHDAAIDQLFSRVDAISSFQQQLDTLLFYAQFYGDNDVEHSLKVGKMGVQRARKAGQMEYEAKFNLEIGYTYFSFSQYDSSLVYYDKVINYAKDLDKKKILAKALN